MTACYIDLTNPYTNRMKRYRSGWEKSKAKRDESSKLQQVLANTKKITDFCSPKNTTVVPADDNPDEVGDPGTSQNKPDQLVVTLSGTANLNRLTTDDGDEQKRLQFSNDLAEWTVSESLREFFTKNGVSDCQHIHSDFSSSETRFPGESFKRRCTRKLFFRDQPNGEKVQRDWLCYSPSTETLFCANCKLFATTHETSLLATTGYNDWRHAARDVSRHENSTLHARSIEHLVQRRLTGERIDKSLVEQYESEKNYWRQVLRRVVSVTKMLAARGQPFRGQDEIIGSVHNGNYLGCLELLAEYDPFLAEHIKTRANKGKGHVSYLSSAVCDEFINILGQEVLQEIISEIKNAKYYSVSVDSTPDISHTDQLTLIFRYVQCDGPVERFVKFIPIHGHTGESLARTLFSFLQENDISIKDCRGQSYDNASNMSGKYIGMQAIVRNENELAEYIPCAAHSLNLVGQSAVSCCTEAVSFFDFVQKLYVFFSASTHRWNLLMDAFKPLGIPTLKRLSDTRWSAHHDAVVALQKGFKSIKVVLQDFSDNISEKPDSRLEATGLASIMNHLQTGIMVHLWSAILGRFNATSKCLQGADMDLNTATLMLTSLSEFVQSLRSRFDEFEADSVKNYGCDAYKEEGKRKAKRNRKWDYTDTVDAELTPSNKFKVHAFIPILDKLLAALKLRSTSYNVVNERFGMLRHLSTYTSDELQPRVKHLVKVYHSDLEYNCVDEFLHFGSLFSKFASTQQGDNHQSVELRMYMFLVDQKLNNAFPNVSIALRMYLSLMVSNCSGERSFSTLKRVKSQLRSTMGQTRLNSLSLMCIESHLLQSMNFNKIIDHFAHIKSRKVQL